MKKIIQSKAFTFAEILIAVGIITLLASAALAGLSTNRSRQILITSAEKAKAALKQVQEFAEHPRSSDFRPLYYGVIFKQTVKEGFTATQVVIPDNNNNGIPDANGTDVTALSAIKDIAEHIDVISLRPATLQGLLLNVKISDSWYEIYITDNLDQPLWLGYRVGDPQHIVAYSPNSTPPAITSPGQIEEANAIFDFADNDTRIAYEKQNPGSKKYPAIDFLNYGAKIDIRIVQ